MGRPDAVNSAVWADDARVAQYAHRSLLPAEVVILARYADHFRGRSLELGCGAGRLLGYLQAVGREVHGVDVSPAMVAYCRERYPGAEVHLGDVRDLATVVTGRFDAVVAPCNILDVFDDEDRRRVLARARTLLDPGGIFIMSAHNLAHADAMTAGDASWRSAPRDVGAQLGGARLGELASLARRIPRRWINRRRLRPLEFRTERYAILNDVEADYGVLHYYVRRDDQEHQLRELGLEPIECLDEEGRSVPTGEMGQGPSLHYVARVSPAD